jgi:hypothetical protein
MKHFPLSVILLFIISGLLIYGIITDFDIAYKEQLIKLILSCIMLFFFTVSVTLISETGKFSKIKIILFHMLTLIFWIVFYTWFTQNIDDIENFIYFMLSIVWIISLLFYAWYSKYIFKKKIENPSYYHYFYSIASVLLLSSIVVGTHSVLWVIWITAILILFDIRIIDEAKVFAYWFVFANILFAPLFALTQIPRKKSFLDITPNNFFHFLIKYIATPFIYIYFFILYAYSLKVLLNFSEWPQWEVSWLVIGFSSFWYLIYIFSYIFEAKNTFIKTFRRLFPFVVVPQIWMLFYAIYLRISQYDVTINRYFIVVFGVWLLWISLYYVCSRKKYLLIIPASLTLMSLVISIWPWSVFHLPITRQLDRLENNLKKANILQGDMIVSLKNSKDIDQKLSGEIYNGIEYVCSFDDCEKIKSLFAEEYKKIQERHNQTWVNNSWRYTKDLQPNKWEIISGITEEIWVERYNNPFNDNYMYIRSEGVFPINTEWYSKIYSFDSYGWYDWEKIPAYYINSKKSIMLRQSENEDIREIYIGEYLKQIEENYNTDKVEVTQKKDVVFVWEDYKLILTYLGQYWNNSPYNVTWYILIK